MTFGWNTAVPPNGFRSTAAKAAAKQNYVPGPLAGRGDDTPPRDRRTYIEGDPRCAGWTRAYDDKDVVALRQRLRGRNGIADLEVVEAGDVERATELFHRDGFVAIADAIPIEQVYDLRRAANDVISTLAQLDPEGAIGGGVGQLPHRYSFGGISASGHMFHRQEWCALIDTPTTTPLLTSIFGSDRYIAYGAGGDLALPGAIEYQDLHSSDVKTELHDPVKGLLVRDLPTPVIHVDFPLVDLTPENGPLRHLPGTHRSRAAIPRLADEPEWMRLSTICPLPAGSAIVRDVRCWHGGTPNLSRGIQATPSIKYMAPWFRSEALIRSMSYDRWRTLTPHAQRISRYVVAGPGEPIVGEGLLHPRRSELERIRTEQLASTDPDVAAAYLRRTGTPYDQPRPG